LKIAIISVRDTGGAAYCLAHAINKITPENQAINMMAQDSYINYPAFVDMGNYNVKLCRDMVYKADAIVFLGYMKPFYEGLRLSKRRLKDKKKLLMCQGSEWRFGRGQLMKEAHELLGKHQICLSSPGLFLPYPKDQPPVPDDVKFLPPIRSFSEIGRRFKLCNQDEVALRSFSVPKRKVVFCHAPTSDVTKGSETFYRVMTQVHQILPQTSFLTIRQRPWYSCLSMLARSDVVFDQDPPFPAAYGGITIEAAIFRLPVVSKVDPDCAAWMKRETGLDMPLVSFDGEEELQEKVLQLAVNTKARRLVGNMTYRFCKAIHDERPVVERFFKIIDGMD